MTELKNFMKLYSPEFCNLNYHIWAERIMLEPAVGRHLASELTRYEFYKVRMKKDIKLNSYLCGLGYPIVGSS